MDDWPPRFTMTPEAAIRVVLMNYQQEKNEAKTVLAMLALVNNAYEQGKRSAQQTSADASVAREEGK
jgi:hypothetical protein